MLHKDTSIFLQSLLDTKSIICCMKVVTQERPLETELDFEEEFIHDDDDLSSDSDVAVVTLEPAMSADAIDSSYLVSDSIKWIRYLSLITGRKLLSLEALRLLANLSRQIFFPLYLKCSSKLCQSCVCVQLGLNENEKPVKDFSY